MAYQTYSRGDKQYLGNKNKMEVHQLSNERLSCQIDEFLNNSNAVGFIPDTLDQAHKDGYDNCAYCLADSKR